MPFYGLVLEVGCVVVQMLACRSCCDEVEKPLRFGMNRPARRDDQCDEQVSFGEVGFVVFRVLGVVSGLQGCGDGC